MAGVTPVSNRGGASSEAALRNDTDRMAPADLTDDQLRGMPAPETLDSGDATIWRLGNPQERREILQREEQRSGQGIAGSTASAPAWAAGSAVSEQGKRILRENPGLTKQWISTENLEGKSGFTPGLENLLQKNGIEVDDNLRKRPASVVSNEPRHRTINGNAARDAIAAEFDQPGSLVRTEVAEQTPIQTEKRPTGIRKVDIVVETPGATPETATRLDIESKLGRAGLDSEIRTQVAKDAWQLGENARLRAWGQRLDMAGRIIRPAGIVIDAATIGQSWRAEGEFGPATQRIAAGVAGGAAIGTGGAWAGAVIGASIGSAVPVIGTIVGGVIGGIFGALAGSWGGEAAAHAAYDAATQP